LSCRELISGEELARPVAALSAVTIDDLDNPYSRTQSLHDQIANRGLSPE
jgi:hypothetical protein